MIFLLNLLMTTAMAQTPPPQPLRPGQMPPPVAKPAPPPSQEVGEAQETVRRVYVKTPSGYMMVLRQGENVMDQLNRLMGTEQIPSASISGQGMVNVKFGFFDAKRKAYDPKEFKNVELASFNGSLAWSEGKPSVHAHGVVTGKDFLAHGGHILEMSVGTGSVEITVIVHDKKFERRFDEKLGANVLGL